MERQGADKAARRAGCRAASMVRCMGTRERTRARACSAARPTLLPCPCPALPTRSARPACTGAAVERPALRAASRAGPWRAAPRRGPRTPRWPWLLPGRTGAAALATGAAARAGSPCGKAGAGCVGACQAGRQAKGFWRRVHDVRGRQRRGVGWGGGGVCRPGCVRSRRLQAAALIAAARPRIPGSTAHAETTVLQHDKLACGLKPGGPLGTGADHHPLAPRPPPTEPAQE